MDAHCLQFLDRVLSGLGLEFVRPRDVRDETNVDKQAVPSAHFEGQLTDRLKEGLRLNITDRAADLGDQDVRFGDFGILQDKGFDLVRDVRNDLHRLAEVFTVALLVQHVPVHLSRGQVGIFRKVLVNKALVMPKVEIGLRTVLGHEDFAMLIRTHRAGIHVHIGVELLRRDLETSQLQQSAEGCCRNAFSESGNNAACNEDIFHSLTSLICHFGCGSPRSHARGRPKRRR